MSAQLSGRAGRKKATRSVPCTGAADSTARLVQGRVALREESSEVQLREERFEV
jgi:hypothetical protein